MDLGKGLSVAWRGLEMVRDLAEWLKWALCVGLGWRTEVRRARMLGNVRREEAADLGNVFLLLRMREFYYAWGNLLCVRENE